MAPTQPLVSSYESQLSTRFYSNSMALEVLVCLILIFILVIEVVKFVKKIYEWQTEYEINLEQKYSEQCKEMLKQKSQQQVLDIPRLEKQGKADRKDEEEAQNKGRSKKASKEVELPPLMRVDEIIKTKMPQLAIIAVNVAMMASYEFVSITAYIALVLIVIGEILGIKQTEHLNLRFILQILSKILMIAWYINIFTVSKPSMS